jgi:AcrR family transcriptional regulator
MERATLGRARRPSSASNPSARSARDVATRQRLLAAATRLFAERGFRRVTVRDICDDASANIASVNYHFGDKERLYREVVETALEAVRGLADHAMSAPPAATATERLRHYIRAHLLRAPSAHGRQATMLRELFRHELSEPTAMSSYIVEQALKPRLRYLTDVVASLLGAGATEDTVRECVMSIQAQCLLPLAAPAALSVVPLKTTTDLERLAEHVVEFSLAGMRARVSGRTQTSISGRGRAARTGSTDPSRLKAARGAGRR